MANPNFLNITSIVGKSTLVNLTTSPTTIITNAANSNQLLKLNSVLAINRGTSAADVTMAISKNGTLFTVANTISVPTKSNLILLNKDLQLYLEENDFVQASASLSSTLVLIVSYEIVV